ncbi:NAD(P)/FAD-dependent oxidoreductase [Nesterenkonia ebinurensis]|uniref:NAD(P)/FAD-dependent oxidoreductase n=1 Tax=Nesterenkonia ebinurensis TaxID=2608252 RepID=UPI00123CC42A|nr:NAD(P)/FAD-dependent oxidoreductase [Nesterenkonia ebinurensis]
MGTTHDQVYDVAIIGGGSAGLSAALILARARRSAVVIDAGAPRNAPAAAAHGLLGQEGVNPLELLERGRQEAASYGARNLQGDVHRASGSAEDGFTLVLNDDSTIRAGQLLIATGVRDDLPSIPGLAERWGRDIVHCPYCHGWEIRDQRIGLLATGPMSAMQALLFHQWSEQMTFFPNGLEFPADQLEKVRALGITIVPGQLHGVDVVDDRLTAAVMDDGGQVGLDALAVPALTTARLDGLDELGVDVAENAAGVAIVADPAGHTSVPGVWAAGNVVNPGMQVSESAANGARVAMTINTEMVFARADRTIADSSNTVGA